MKKFIPFLLLSLFIHSCNKPSTSQTVVSQKDTIKVDSTVTKLDSSKLVLSVCDTCLSADIALDSIQAKFYENEIAELDIAKSLYTVNQLKKQLNKDILLFKKLGNDVRLENKRLKALLNTSKTIVIDTTNVSN